MAEIIISNARKGDIGQICGPQSEGTTISFQNTPILYFGIVLDAHAAENFEVKINNDNGSIIKLGKTGIYESNEGVQISSFFLEYGAPESFRLDYVVLDT